MLTADGRRTLVAMAAYSSRRLMIGKVEIDSFLLSHGDILILFNRNVYWYVVYVSEDFCLNR